MIQEINQPHLDNTSMEDKTVQLTQDDYIAKIWEEVKDFDINKTAGKKEFTEVVFREIYEGVRFSKRLYDGQMEVQTKTVTLLNQLIDKSAENITEIQKVFDRNGLK